MGLINNPNKKDPLDRGREIKPQEEFTVEDLKQSKQEENNSQAKSNVDRVTFYSNVRIDNHIKNRLEAIATIGISTSQRNSLEKALDVFLDSLSVGDRKAVDVVTDTLEQRDVRQKSKK